MQLGLYYIYMNTLPENIYKTSVILKDTYYIIFIYVLYLI